MLLHPLVHHRDPPLDDVPPLPCDGKQALDGCQDLRVRDRSCQRRSKAAGGDWWSQGRVGDGSQSTAHADEFLPSWLEAVLDKVLVVTADERAVALVAVKQKDEQVDEDRVVEEHFLPPLQRDACIHRTAWSGAH